MRTMVRDNKAVIMTTIGNVNNKNNAAITVESEQRQR